MERVRLQLLVFVFVFQFVFGVNISQCEEFSSINFRLKWVIYGSFSSHFVALEKEFFKNEGLNVSIKAGGEGIDPIRLVASGTDDVGLAGHEEILIAREKGIPVVAIGEDFIRSGVGFFTLKDSGIRTPKDFTGKKVGIRPGTDKYTLYCAMLTKEGIDRTKIEEIPNAFNLSMLFNKTVDIFPGFITNQPHIAKSKGFEVNIIDPYDYGIRPGGNVYFTSEKMLKERPNDLTKFLKGVIKGILYAQKLKNEEVIEILFKYNKEINKETEVKVWESTKNLLLEKEPKQVAFLSEKKWIETADMSFKYGLISKIPTISECYTNKLVELAHTNLD